MNNMTLRRVQKEYKALQDDPKLLPNAIVVPNPDNLLEWHFVVYGLDAPYEGGVYHGLIILPQDYPKRPPEVRMYTPSGRFLTNQALCLSISNYHPESWNPGWKVYHVILGLISVMTEDVEFGIGMIMDSEQVRQKYAKDSIQFNTNRDQFNSLFKVCLFSEIDLSSF